MSLSTNNIFTVLTEKLMSKKKAAGSNHQPLSSLNVLRAVAFRIILLWVCR